MHALPDSPPRREDDALLTPREAAEMLRVSPATLADWRVDRRGPAFIRFGRVVRYRMSAIRAHLDSCTHAPERRAP